MLKAGGVEESLLITKKSFIGKLMNEKRIYGITAEGKRIMKDRMFELMKQSPHYIVAMEIVQSMTAQDIIDAFPGLTEKQKNILKAKIIKAP